ncbi:MAG: hypothetical protein JWO03_3390 [Bacteroidetes bacterium]|nr:hypothetical protein [Bacteroidota bacterium]
MMNDTNKRPWRFLWLGRMIVMRSVFAIIIAEAVMILWNMILPSLIHVSAINYWQALGLLVLARLLTGRAGGHGCGPGGGRWHGKWNNMTAEERQAFRDEWRKRR